MMNFLKRTDPLILSAYLVLAGVTASGILETDRVTTRWLALVLLVIFGTCISRYPNPAAIPAQTRRANLLVGLQVVLTILLILISGAVSSFVILFFILSATVMRYNTLRQGLLWILGFVLVTGWFFHQHEGLEQMLRVVLIYTGGFAFVGTMTHTLTQSRLAQAQIARLLVELQAKNRQLEEYATQVETLAAAEERNRLAREVHDTVGHRLTAAAVQIEAAQRLIPLDPEKAANLAGAGREQVREALQELRQVVGRLREPLEVDLPLEQALRRLAASFESATGLVITLDLPPESCTLSAAHRLALYRAAQEGLTNIQRHARATRAWLHLCCFPTYIELSLRDDGLGLRANDAAGFGLRGLSERAAQLGGTCNLQPLPEGGALLSIRLPLKTEQ